MKILKLIICVVLVLQIYACVHQVSPDLEGVRVEFQKLQNDPVINNKAAIALYDVEKAIAAAEQIWAAKGDAVELEQMLYLIRRKLEICRMTAEHKTLDDELTQLRNVP